MIPCLQSLPSGCTSKYKLAILAESQARKKKMSCTPASMYVYYKDLEKSDTCEDCSRKGLGVAARADGSLACSTSPKTVACPAAPSHPCYPLLQPPTNVWDLPTSHSWGSPVYDERYKTTILYGTWNDATKMPYLAESAPFLMAGKNQCC